MKSKYKEWKPVNEIGSLMPGKHILMWLLAKAEIPQLQSEAPKSTNLQRNLKTELIIFLIALVSYLLDSKIRRNVSIVFAFFYSQISQHSKIKSVWCLWTDPPSES